MKKPLWEEIGHRVRLIREKLNLLQKELAKDLEISNASLSEIEAGYKKPRFELLYNISTKFNVNLVYLLQGKGDMFLDSACGPLGRVGQMDSYGEHSEFLENFFSYFKRSKLVRYSIMAFFTSFLLQNEGLIEKELKGGAGQNDPDHDRLT